MNPIIASVSSQATALFSPWNLVLFAIFVLAGVFALLLGYKVFDKFTPGDLHGEIFKGNTAVAILAGFFLLSLSIIIAAAMS